MYPESTAYQQPDMFAKPMIQLDIVSLSVFDAGIYTPVHVSPYELHTDGDQLSIIKRNIENAGAGLAGISEQSFNGIASTMLRPSMHAQHQIQIPGGWGNKRLRFILVVSETRNGGNPAFYYFQGFTNYDGIAANGAPAADMVFYINAYQRAVPIFNGQFEDINITEKAQIVNGTLIRDPEVGDAYKLRPMDLFQSVQSNYIQNTYRDYNNDTAIDTRLRFGNDTIVNRRDNNVAGKYLGTLLGNYGTAQELLSYGQKQDDLHTRSVELTAEKEVDEISFIRKLSTVRGLPSQTVFTVSDLYGIDPSVHAKMSYKAATGNAQAIMPNGYNVGQWTDRTNESLWAKILSNAIPALMLDCLMGEVHFTVTNNTVGGMIVSQPHNFASITGANTVRQFETMMRRVVNEIVGDLNRLQQSFTITIKVNLYHFAEFNIQFNGGEFVRFQAPTFCDSLFVPTATSQESHHIQLTHGIDSLLNNISSDIGTVAQQTSPAAINHGF